MQSARNLHTFQRHELPLLQPLRILPMSNTRQTKSVCELTFHRARTLKYFMNTASFSVTFFLYNAISTAILLKVTETIMQLFALYL